MLFLPGCNFRCPYCHNADLALGGLGLSTWPLSVILARLKQLRGWIDGVCVTGGEPTLQAGLPSILAVLREHGFRTKLDTNGSNPDMLRRLLNDGLVDYVAMDVKAPLNMFAYSQCTGGLAPLRAVEESIGILIKSNVSHQFRTTVVPRLHTIEDILRLAEQLRGAMDYRLQNFNPGRTLDPSFQNEPPYEHATFRELERRSRHIVRMSDLEARLQA